MNKIDATFKKLKENKRKAFISYVTAGDPDIKMSENIIKTLMLSGVDIAEIGIPFSDPVADGPTIQKAIYRSLASGCTVRKIMQMTKRISKQHGTPMVFMTYYNIVFNYGIRKFIKDSILNGVDGIIVPDLPMEESAELLNVADEYDFKVILLAAPTTPVKRFRKIASISGGFVYYVSLTGVTGARKMVPAKLKKSLGLLKSLTNKPVCVGFGISNGRQASEITAFADGVIVGSAIIDIIEKHKKNRRKLIKAVKKFAGKIAGAVHGE